MTIGDNSLAKKYSTEDIRVFSNKLIMSSLLGITYDNIEYINKAVSILISGGVDLLSILEFTSSVNVGYLICISSILLLVIEYEIICEVIVPIYVNVPSI